VKIADLRLNDPFSTLEEYVENFDFESLTVRENSHVPYPVILLREIKNWKASHDD